MRLSNTLAQTKEHGLVDRLKLTLTHTQLLVACRGDALDVDWMLLRQYKPHWLLPESRVGLTVNRIVNTNGLIPSEAGPSRQAGAGPGSGPASQPAHLVVNLAISPVELEARVPSGRGRVDY